MAPKRTSGAKAPTAKKAKIVAPEAPVLDFIHKLGDIPKPCREMLEAAVPICFEVVASERHQFQVDILEKVATLIADVECKKREAIAGAEAELAEIQVEQGKSRADAEAKQSVSASKKSECDEKGKVVDAARDVSNGAKAVLTAAQKEEATFNKKKAALLAEQEGFAKLLSETLQPLKDGTLGGQKRTKMIGEIKNKLSELGAQASLGEAVVTTLKMTPEKRAGTFAKATMSFADEYFAKHTAKLSQDISGLDAEAAMHTAAIAAAEARAAQEKAALDVVDKEWDTMQDGWLALEKESADAARALQKIEAGMPKVTRTIEKLKADLDKFLETPALFAKLKEHSTKVPEEPEEPEEADEVMPEEADEVQA